MTIHEYGEGLPKHLLFFQGSCEPWEEFSEAARLLSVQFHVILVTPDGHDPAEHTDFISVEKTVDDTVSWLHANGIRHLDADRHHRKRRALLRFPHHRHSTTPGLSRLNQERGTEYENSGTDHEEQTVYQARA